MHPALVLLEFGSIAVGIQAGDAMAKRARLATLALGTVHPGKFLVAADGEVANVEEVWMIGRDVGGRALVGEIFLPEVHPEVVEALFAPARSFAGDALGVIETSAVSATLRAADRALKGTDVSLDELRLADGLGGKGYVLVSGDVGEVSAAIEIAVEAVSPDDLVSHVVIPQLHDDVARNLSIAPEFARHWQPQTVRTAATRPTARRKKTARKTATRRTTR